MKIQLKPIHEQVVVIFGATSGIGLQTALMMAHHGARVAIVGRNEHSVNQAVERVRDEMRAERLMKAAESSPFVGGGDMPAEDTSANQRVLGLVADATRWEEVKAAADQAVAHFGRIDTWVQTAAVSEWALFEDTSPEEFRQVIDVNLTGMAYGAMAALPYLKQQDGGAIILISSVAGRAPLPYQSAYSASKHGVVALANVLRMEMKHEGHPISVTNILPSSINTPLFNKARTKLGVEPHPIPPIYAPELVAQAIMYAAQHPIREISVGGAGWFLQGLRRVSPALANAYMGTAAFEQQRSDQPKTAIAPDNLFSHVEGYNHVDGEYGMKTMRTSPQLWLATHPKARMALNLALLAGAGYLGYRAISSHRQPSAWEQAQKRVRSQVKQVSQRMPDRLPFQRKRSTFDSLLGTLSDLPVIGLLPFLHKPTFTERIQHGLQKGVDRLPDRLLFQRKHSRFEPVQDAVHSVMDGAQDVFHSAKDRLPDRLPFQRKHSRFEPVQDAVQHVMHNAEYALRNAQERLPDRLPFQRKRSRFDGLLEVLASLPVIGMLPFLRKPTLKERVQRSVQHGVERIPVQETVHATQDMLKRAKDRLPVEQTEKMVEKIQERIPRRREKLMKEVTLENMPESVDVDVRVVQRDARKAEKLASRL